MAGGALGLLPSLALLSSAPLIAALPYVDGWISSAMILMLAFILIAFGNLLLVTAFQQWAPVELLGRLTGVLMLASVGMMPLSTLIAGFAIHLVGAQAYFPLDAVSVVVAAMVQLSSPAWRRFDPAAGSSGTSLVGLRE